MPALACVLLLTVGCGTGDAPERPAFEGSAPGPAPGPAAQAPAGTEMGDAHVHPEADLAEAPHDHETEHALDAPDDALHDQVAMHDHGLGATAGPGYTVADVEFMQMMIVHHQQALVMAEMANTHGAGSSVLALALRIEISQEDEIALMARWLRERDQPVPDESHMETMHMPGMLTPEQLSQLDEARGEEFDRLFLTLMIQHHVGALDMVDELFASPGAAQDSEIFRFATDVGSDQLDEIGVMETLLARMASTSPE